MLHHHLSTHTDCSCTIFLHEIQFYSRGFLLKKARIFCFLHGSAGRRKVSVSETGFVRTCPPQHLNLNRKTPSDTSLPVELLVSGLILWAHVKITFRQRLHSQGVCCCYSPPSSLSHTSHSDSIRLSAVRAQEEASWCCDLQMIVVVLTHSTRQENWALCFLKGAAGEMTTGWQEVSKSSWCIIVKLWETNLDSEAGLIVRFSADEIYKFAAFLSLSLNFL